MLYDLDGEMPTPNEIGGEIKKGLGDAWKWMNKEPECKKDLTCMPNPVLPQCSSTIATLSTDIFTGRSCDTNEYSENYGRSLNDSPSASGPDGQIPILPNPEFPYPHYPVPSLDVFSRPAPVIRSPIMPGIR